MELGDRIKHIRSELDLTLERFCEKLSLNQYGWKFDASNISKYERGKVLPGTEFYIAIRETFDVDINWLLMGVGIEFKKPPMNYEEEASKVNLLFKNQA